MLVEDLTELFKNFQNLWVALDEDNNVISSADSLEEVLQLSRQKGFDNPVTAHIPDFETEYVL